MSMLWALFFGLSFLFSYSVCIEDMVDGGDETPTGAWILV